MTDERTEPDASDLPAEVVDLFGIHRDVRAHRDLRGGLLSVIGRRDYPATVETVWAALSEPDQLARWFLPVTGDLRPGGEFQTEGNAGGEIRKCESPTLLKFTWGDESSVVELRLGPTTAGGTTLELEHTVPMTLAVNGTGAFFVGPGWDAALQALGDYLSGAPITVPGSIAEQAFNKKSLLAWALAIEASGTASPDEVMTAVQEMLPQWAPDLS